MKNQSFSDEYYQKGFDDGYRKAQDDVISVLHEMALDNEVPEYATMRILANMKPEKAKPKGFTDVRRDSRGN